MALKLKDREVECETCKKKIKRKGGIAMIVNDKILPFFCCSWDCLSIYVNEVASHEDSP